MESRAYRGSTPGPASIDQGSRPRSAELRRAPYGSGPACCQLAYPALARAPHRFSSAALLPGAYPAYVRRNARRSLRQLWASRFIVFFRLAGRRVTRNDFAYVERLWRRPAPSFTPPTEHLARVKRTFAASMPALVAMYRAGGIAIPPEPVPVPTRDVGGAEDGCALPLLADGQGELFSGGYGAET
ncbi:hypothetical protein ACI797_08265 [Geodermatophilus sp. SYSU D00691]